MGEMDGSRAEEEGLGLTAEAVALLERGANSCSDWSRVRCLSSAGLSVASLSRIQGCTFSFGGDDGEHLQQLVLLGDFSHPALLLLEDGVALPPGLYNSTFSGRCVLQDGSRVSDTLVVRNASLGKGGSIVGCGKVIGDGRGGGILTELSLSLGPENGGRDVVLRAGTLYGDICRRAFGQGEEEEEEEDNALSSLPPSSSPAAAQTTVLGDGVQAFRCDLIRNVVAGPGCVLSCSTLDRCVLTAAARVEGNAVLKECILHEGCTASNGCRAEKVFMLESSSLGENARVAQSVIGPDASVAGGECHHSLVGPFVGFHHHSLLIATLWPLGRGNVGYGAMSGSNHTGRVNDQECWLGEGVFLGLGSALKLPCNLLAAPYSMIAARAVVGPIKLSLPFSLLLGGEIKPGWVLYGSPYTLERAAVKFQSRRRAKQHATNFPLIRPSLVDLVVSGRDELRVVAAAASISDRDRERGLAAYSSFVQRYALRGLLAWILKGCPRLPPPSPRLALGGFEKGEEEEEKVLAHQLSIVEMEFGHIPSPSDRAAAEPLLAKLVTLEIEYATAVEESKQRDTDRGKEIIPDYLDVNASAKNGDAIVKQAWNKCRQIEESVKALF